MATNEKLINDLKNQAKEFSQIKIQAHNRKSHNTWGNMLIWVRLITNSRFGLGKTSKWTKCSSQKREITQRYVVYKKHNWNQKIQAGCE